MLLKSSEPITVPPDATIAFYANKAELSKIEECCAGKDMACTIGIDAATGFPVIKDEGSNVYYVSMYSTSQAAPIWFDGTERADLIGEYIKERKRLVEIQASPRMRKSPPISAITEAEAPQIKFEPYGPREDAGTWKYNRGWTFETPSEGEASDIVAVSSGTLHFLSSSGPLPNIIALRIDEEEGRACAMAGMPEWFPAPKWILYCRVDADEARRALLPLLKADRDRLTRTIAAYNGRNKDDPIDSAEALLDVFLDRSALPLPEGIPVNAGEKIGKGTRAADPQRRAFEMQFTQQWPASGRTENPAFYFNIWSGLKTLDLAGNPFSTRWLRLDQGAQSNGIMRFVSKKSGSDGNAPFTDPGKPAKSLTRAISDASDGDTIVIVDGEVYAEKELVVTKALNITSSRELASDQAHLGGGTEIPAEGAGCRPMDRSPPAVPADLPALQGPEDYSAIKEDMTTDYTFFPTKDVAHRVLQFKVPPSSGIASLTKVVVRYGGAREGGGIYVSRDSRVVIASCHIHRNIAYFNPLFFIKDHPVFPDYGGLPHPFTGSGWFQEGFGGGIFANRSSPIIWGNRIERNLAISGGAIGAFAYCFLLIAENYIAKNAGPDWLKSAGTIGYAYAEHEGIYTPSDGGAIRILTASLRYDNAEELEKAVKGKYPNTSPDEPVVIEAGLMYDADGVKSARASWIHIRGNQIRDNFTNDDGGGVYATGVSRVFSQGNWASGNTARCGDGGGYRISTGSVLLSIHDEIINNETTGKVEDLATGGGIAVRCGDCALFSAHVSGNKSHFAGAGIAFTVTREGEVTGVEWLKKKYGFLVPTWDVQRREALVFNHSHLMIDGTSSIERNASDDKAKGKGGGLFALRFADKTKSFIGDQFSLRIENCSAVLKTTNKSAFVGEKPKDGKPRGLTYHRICLQDMTRPGIDGSKVLVKSDIDIEGTVGDFFYESL
jgi:hypothetical protein